MLGEWIKDQVFKSEREAPTEDIPSCANCQLTPSRLSMTNVIRYGLVLSTTAFTTAKVRFISHH